MSSPAAPRRSPRAALIVVFAAVFVTIFARQKARAPVPALTGATPPFKIGVTAFQQLRWLDGDWSGSGGGVDAFYERYRWIDDSTIAKFSLKDPSGAIDGDSSEFALRDSVLTNSGGDLAWVAVALDSVSVRFAPASPRAKNGFEFRRASASTWIARLTWDSAGVPRERIYQMRAIVRKP